MLISIGLYVFNVVCAARLAICRIALVRLAMQSCVLCSFEDIPTSNQIEEKKERKKKTTVIYLCITPGFIPYFKIIANRIKDLINNRNQVDFLNNA